MSLIDRAVKLVQEGNDPSAVIESVILSAGVTAKVNKPSKGYDPENAAAVTVPEGTVVTIAATGAGLSGVDYLVLLPSGRQAVIPFNDLSA